MLSFLCVVLRTQCHIVVSDLSWHCVFKRKDLKICLFLFLCVSVYCMSVHHMCAWDSQRSEKGTDPPESELTESC